MFMRLCVVVLSMSVQTALAEVSDFDKQLNSYQERQHKDCRIKSPAMKLAYACSRIEASGANPRFYKTIDAGEPGSPSRSSNGVNFCYNALVNVASNGDQLRISVLKDSGASARETRYIAKRGALKSEGGNYLLPLEGLEGKCFTYSAGNDLCSNGIFGMGNTHVPMALTLNLNDGIHQSLTADRQAIKAARRNGSQFSSASETNSAEATKAAIAYARTQLLARAKQNMSGVNPTAPKVLPLPGTGTPDPSLAYYKECDEMLINMENSLNPPMARDPGEEAVLAEYRKRLKTPAPGATPGSGSPGGVRERPVGGR